MSTIRWALAGTGRIAERFVADMRYSRFGRVTAIASRDRARAANFAREHVPSAVPGRLDDVLAMSAVDAVYIAGRNEDHADQACRCLEAGKPVLIEKPLAPTLDEAERIRAVAGRMDRLAMEAMWMRFTPAIRRLKSLVDDGRIGEVRAIEATLSFRNRTPPASVLLDLGVYPVSLSVMLLGPPAAIDSRSAGRQPVTGLVLGYDGAIASLGVGFAMEGANQLVVTGETGIITSNAPFICPSMLTLRRTAGAACEPPSDGGRAAARPSRSRYAEGLRSLFRPLRATRILAPFEGTGLHYQADHFAQCLADGLTQSPIMPLRDSIETIRILETASRQLIEGTLRESSVNPQKTS